MSDDKPLQPRAASSINAVRLPGYHRLSAVRETLPRVGGTSKWPELGKPAAARLLVHPPASAGVQELSRQPVRLVRGQQHYHLRNILRHAATAERSARTDRRLLFRR